jgi:hypothetical protein
MGIKVRRARIAAGDRQVREGAIGVAAASWR